MPKGQNAKDIKYINLNRIRRGGGEEEEEEELKQKNIPFTIAKNYKMLKMKSQNKVYPEEFWFLTLDMAFYVLFRDLSYDETLMHGVAVECLAEDIKF